MLIKTIGKMVLFLSLTSNALAEGHDYGPGNGGDTITCHNHSTYNGTYFLDYLAAIMDTPNADYYESTDEVIELLKNKIPSLAERLQEMSIALHSEGKSNRYIWKNMEPKDQADEDLSFEIPTGCQSVPKQLILRRSFNKKRSYFFAKKEKVNSLGKQKSWALLHEVLWDFYNSSFEIRIVNEFIHNKANSHLSSEEFINEIKSSVSPYDFPKAEYFNAIKSAEKKLHQVKTNEHLYSEAQIKEILHNIDSYKNYSLLLMELYQYETDIGRRAFDVYQQLIDFQRRYSLY